MKRTDIQIITKKTSTTILTDENQFTFSSNGENIMIFCTAKFTTIMLDEIESSKILQVEKSKWIDNYGIIELKKKDFFEDQIFIEIIIDLIEKHNL